jgi:metal-responsive CopG/Arc/MetJ family transcriptional regulator
MPTVQVRMLDNTITQVDEFQQRVRAPSRSDAIRRAIEIADLMSKYVEDGAEVTLDKKNGKKYRILIPGMNQ